MSKGPSSKETIENNSDDLASKSDPLTDTENLIETSIVTAAGTAAVLAGIISAVPLLFPISAPLGLVAAASGGVFAYFSSRNKRKKLDEEQEGEE